MECVCFFIYGQFWTIIATLLIG